MDKQKLFGGILFIAAVLCYALQPFESDFFDFLSGIIGAIGFSLIFGWFKRK